MKIPIETLANTESGPAVIIGNGPSMNDFKGRKFCCPIIGINLSVAYWPKQDYFVTVAYDRLQDIVSGKITADKAVFTCLHKAHVVPDSIPQPVAFADMSKDDLYLQAYKQKISIFNPDLTQPTYKTFGGIFAVQVGFFLGFNPLYVIGFDGGTHHFKDYRRDNIPPEYHNFCFWSVFDWLEKHPEYKLYNCNKASKITWFEYALPPMKGDC